SLHSGYRTLHPTIATCRSPARAADNIRPDGGTKQPPLSEVISEFSFPQIPANSTLSEAKCPCEVRSDIRVIGLKVIAPAVVSAQLKGRGDVITPSDTEQLIV